MTETKKAVLAALVWIAGWLLAAVLITGTGLTSGEIILGVVTGIAFGICYVKCLEWFGRRQTRA